MANLLNTEITQQVRQIFAELKEPVQVLFFGQKAGCDYCADTLELVEEVAALSDKLGITAYDLDDNQAIARQFHVDKAPMLVITGRDGDQIKDYGVRFAGIPSGHEFSTLIHDLVLVSGRDSGLDTMVRDFLKKLSEPVFLQVFTTPT